MSKEINTVKGNDFLSKEIIYWQKKCFTVKEKNFQRKGNTLSLNKYIFVQGNTFH